MVELMDAPPNSPVPLQIKSYIRSKISDQPEHVQAFISRYKLGHNYRYLMGPNDAVTLALCSYGGWQNYPIAFV